MFFSYLCIMIDSDSPCTSGIPNAQDFNMPRTFEGHELIASRGHFMLYRAQRYSRWYVLKGLRPEHRGNPLFMTLLEKEFDVLAGLDHPNIVRLYSHETDSVAGPCIVMEYVDGRTLDAFVKEHPPAWLRRKVALQLLDAMHCYQSRQLVHRDLKPSNIIITHNGDNVKLIAFGLADGDSYAVLKESAYSDGYAAPEQREAGAAIDCRTDLYAFGVLLGKLFTHRYRRIARRCSHPDPAKRYPSAASVRKALLRAHRMPGVLAATAVALAAIAATLLMTFRQSASHENDTIYKTTEQSEQKTQLKHHADSLMAEYLDLIDSNACKEHIAGQLAAKNSTIYKTIDLSHQKTKLKHHADSLMAEFLDLIDGNACNEYMAEQLAAKYQVELQIITCRMMFDVTASSEQQWDSCWTELNNIVLQTAGAMRNKIQHVNWPETPKEGMRTAEFESLRQECNSLLDSLISINARMLQHRKIIPLK